MKKDGRAWQAGQKKAAGVFSEIGERGGLLYGAGAGNTENTLKYFSIAHVVLHKYFSIALVIVFKYFSIAHFMVHKYFSIAHVAVSSTDSTAWASEHQPLGRYYCCMYISLHHAY